MGRIRGIDRQDCSNADRRRKAHSHDTRHHAGDGIPDRRCREICEHTRRSAGRFESSDKNVVERARVNVCAGFAAVYSAGHGVA